MVTHPSAEVHSALQLMRSGRFSDAALLLEHNQNVRKSDRRPDLLADAVFADALQRIGRNERAHEIALQNLSKVKHAPALAARYHFVLGNINRERGYTTRALEHFQMAASMAGSDLELACWSQLRLMLVIAERSGTQTALARLDDVKRSLARFGDARAFATLHLWLVEAESTRGDLASARRHLIIAESLLSNVEDVWLRGYVAINSSALNYYSADTAEAQRCAQEAIEYAHKSGHRTTMVAAHANLGNIEFALGALDKSENCFQIALSCCEKGSVNEIAILDNIAQIQLQIGDLDKCRLLISRLEELVDHNEYAKRRHYNSSALLTKSRLLLRERQPLEALRVMRGVKQLLAGSPPTRMATEVHLLCAETLLANGETGEAAESLASVSSPGDQLSPDLFARREQLTGRTLASSRAFALARVHLERAVRTFGVIGHSLGMECSQQELASMPEQHLNDNGYPSQRSLDRLRALLDLRSRPELFGHEATSFLEELDCAQAIELSVNADGQRRSIRRVGVAEQSSLRRSISITLNPGFHRTVTMSFIPMENPCCRLTAAAFENVIKQILSVAPVDAISIDKDIAWNSEGSSSTRDGAVFASDAMRTILRMVKQIAPTDVSVLVTGETGTGKEVIARTIHDHSLRSAMPFIALNCAAVPKDLLESQLFGYKKGAFSGASENYQGIARASNGGTLFLDEVGEVPLEMQAKLLRFLEMSEVHPVGEAYPVKVNVRLIFATNGDLEEAVIQNRFRRDLFYRLNVIPVRIPPLRERKEEIPVLTNVFARRFALELSKKPIELSASAMELLILHSWPGNLRELSNEIRRLAVLKESGALIAPDELSSSLHRPKRSRGDLDARTGPHITVGMDQPLDTATMLLETEMITHALHQAGGHLSTAAAMLGISRKGLYLKRLRLGLIPFNENRATLRPDVPQR